MRPCEIVRLSPQAFNSAVVCLGSQLADVVTAIGEVRSDLSWYAAHVQGVGPWPTSRENPLPVLVGDTEALIRAARNVEQFESGVFAGVSGARDQPVFRDGGLWTEDEDDADLGDAIVEVRAFDTTYWLIATTDAEIARRLRDRFPSGS